MDDASLVTGWSCMSLSFPLHRVKKPSKIDFRHRKAAALVRAKGESGIGL
jgi:hypothetical protein